MSDWQPIETAPKDGTPVILFAQTNEQYYRQFWFAAHWIDTGDFAGWVGSSFWSQPEGNWTVVAGENVTHWQPIPDPPAEASR